MERKLHHNSAVCHLAAVLATRIVACLRAGTPYQIRGLDGQAITATQGRILCQELRVQPNERPRPGRQRKAGQATSEVAQRLTACPAEQA